MSHSRHDNCKGSDACYEWGYGAGFRDAWENSERAEAERDAHIRTRDEWGQAPLAREAEADLSRLRSAVEALHHPDPSGDWCDHCWTGPDSHGNGNSPAWPCATIRLLTEGRDRAGEGAGT